MSFRLLSFTPLAAFPRTRRSRTHRRRTHRHSNNKKLTKKPSSESQNLELTIDIDELQSKASYSLQSLKSRFHQFIDNGNHAVRDLQTLVTVDPVSRGVVLSCKKSTLQFVGYSLLVSYVVVFAFRGLVRLLFRNSGGFGSGGSVVVKRDRSLGGKEVVVGVKKTDDRDLTGSGIRRPGYGGKSEKLPNWWLKFKGESESSVSDLDKDYRKEGNTRVRQSEKLPNWWPISVGEKRESSVLDVDKEEYRREANRLIRVITDNRMAGKDISEDDIIQLRNICRASGIQVSINTANIRDNLFRAAIDFVLNVCSRAPTYASSIHINGEHVLEFVADLAGDIGLESIRAARMVSAAVAARVRSRFLQAWALEMQGNHTEAISEVSKICLILRTFPPDELSPEMDMVARGLAKHLKVEQREFLLNMFAQICSSESLNFAAEALGLTLPLDGFSRRQEKVANEN